MSIQQIKPRTSILLFIIIIITALRLLTQFTDHSSLLLSLTPIGAIALFGGAYFKGRLTPFLFTLLPLFISDVILCFTVYSGYREGLLYPGWFWVYAAFGLIVMWGKWIINEISFVNVVMAILVATVTHWVVGNVGECLAVNSGKSFFQLFGSRLITGITYEIKFLLGTMVYTLFMFGSFELAQKKFSRLRVNTMAS